MLHHDLYFDAVLKMLSVPLTKETMIPGNDDYDPYYDEEKESTPKTNIIENIEKVAGERIMDEWVVVTVRGEGCGILWQ